MPLRSYADRKYCLDIPSGISTLLVVQGFERLAFHGLRVTLAIYMFEHLLISSQLIVLTYHLFNTAVFISASLAMPIAKSHCGKYFAVIVAFVPYLIGHALLLLTSMYEDHPQNRIFFPVSLPLIAFGGGFLYSCITLMIMEQNDRKEEQEEEIRNVMLCNFLGLVWMFMARLLIPEMQSVVSCFGKDCYLASFILIVSCAGLAAILFVVLGFSYVDLREPSEEVACRIFCLIVCGNCWRRPKARARYLDENRQNFSDEERGNIEGFWNSTIYFVQLAIFWSCCCQQGSTWTLQATEMNSFLSFLDITPSQIQIFFPLFFIVLAPLQEVAILPLLRKMKIDKRQNRQFIGSIFSVLAAGGAWLLQEYITRTKEGIFAGSENSKNRPYYMGQDQSSLELLCILWQIPQYFFLAFAAVIFLTTTFEVTSLRLTGSYHDIGVMICFLSMSCGEAITGLLYFILSVDKKTWFMINAICQAVACVLIRVITLLQGFKRTQ